MISVIAQATMRSNHFYRIVQLYEIVNENQKYQVFESRRTPKIYPLVFHI